LVIRYLDSLKKKPAVIIAKFNMKKAERTVSRRTQEKHFSELDDSRIKKLRPFKDDQGWLRIKTELIFGMEVDNYVLPDNSRIIKVITLKEQETLSHARVQVLQSI
ncbi:hypothetical protein ILUMI_01826, partial [Ignelater luminosus]